MAADPYVGTWSVENIPGFGDQNTPWKNGGSITLTAASRGEVMAFHDVQFGGQPLRDYCFGDPVNPPTNYTPPVVSGWYLVSTSWAGAAGGCISNHTDGSVVFYGQGGAGQVKHTTFRSQLCPKAPCLTGVWRAKVIPTDWLYFYAPQGAAGTTKTVSEPAPGKSTTIDSPPVPAKCAASARAVASTQVCEIILDGGTGKIAIAEEGDVTFRGDDPTLFFFWCWLNYFPSASKLSPHDQLVFCLDLTVGFAKEGSLGVPRRIAARSSVAASAETATAGAGCKTKAIPIALRKRGGKLVVVGPAKKAKLPAGSTRYACSFSDGKATLTVTAPRGLRKAVGKTLTLGAYKPKTAPRGNAKLRVTFGWK